MKINYTDKTTWTVDAIHDFLKENVNPGRYQHTLGVVKAAQELADVHGVDKGKAEYAALCHDILKGRTRDWLLGFIRENGEDPGEGVFAWKTLHAQAGAIFAQGHCGIFDADVLNAIRFHTTGRAHMSPLEKIIFVADYIEVGRNFPGVEEIRETARIDLDCAVLAALECSLVFLEEKGEHVMPLSLEARNHYKALAAERNHHE